MEPTSLSQHAATCLAQGHYDRAIALYEQAIQTQPDHRANYWHLGLAYFLQGNVGEAQAIWIAVLTESNPDDMEHRLGELQQVLAAAAQAAVNSGRLQQATHLYEQLLEFDETQAETYDQLGQVLALQGKLDEAIAAWNSALELAPDWIDVHLQCAKVLQTIEQFEDAIAHYSTIIRLNPNHAEAIYQLGFCLFQQNQFDEAIVYLDQALEFLEDRAVVYGDLGAACLRTGDLERAISYWHQATIDAPNFVQHYEIWSSELKARSKLDELTAMNAEFIHALDTQPNSFQPYFFLGQLLTRNAIFENSQLLAIAAFQKALEFHPNHPDVYVELGKQWLKLGHLDEAIAALTIALRLQPNRAEIYLELGKTFAQQGKLEEAIAHYQTALQHGSTQAETYFHWGDALALTGDWQAAINAYQQKIRLQPDGFDAYYRIGVLLLEQGQVREAIPYFETAMKLAPQSAEVIHKIWENHQHLLNLDDQNSLSLPIDSPNGFYETAQDWAIATQVEKTHYFPVYSDSLVPLKLPHSLETSVDVRFRLGEALLLPGSFVAIVPQGRYWIDEWNRTAVITADQKILGDLSPDFPILTLHHPDKHPSHHSLFKFKNLPPVQFIPGTVAVLSTLFNDAYFHWMLDVLPRLELIRLSGISKQDIDFYLVNQTFAFQQESLTRLGIATAQVLEPKHYPHIQSDRLIVPSFPGAISWMPAWTCDFLKQLFLDESTIRNSPKIERLYITRNQASNRRLINETAVIDLLEGYGFRSVALESLAIAEQAALLYHAKVIVAPHGGGLTNIVFCQPGTKVIELFSPNYVYPCYWFISNLAQLEYYYLLGEVPFGFHFNKLIHPNSRTEDIVINIDQFVDTLRLANVI